MIDTIAAIATPPGEGGIAVIRISGPKALKVADAVFSGPVHDYKTHTVHFGKIHSKGEIIDEVLLVVMKGPRSYTGEDTVEIQCHGGSLITRRVFETVLAAGAKPAGPGEFTKQAFLNNKIDLAQAEAVQTFIGAKNTLSLDAAKHQLSGVLSTRIQTFQQELLDIAAILEAWVDFPEEGLEFASKEEVIGSLETTLSHMQTLESTFHEGRKIHEGLKLCLIGPPNAGKSSLMNTLLGHDRAIVTPIPGTTRDRLEADLTLFGLHFQLTDTAGIRVTEEIVEQEGIRRSKLAMQEADLILLLIDASAPSEHEALLATAPKEKTLIIWNKIDLPHTIPTIDVTHQVSLSAKTGQNLESLKTKLEEMIWHGGPPAKDEIVLTNVRHKTALSSAITDLKTLITGLKTDISPEFLSADMRSCLKNLGQIIGLDISEDILSAIFAKFCVGK
ncbi:MAG: tRNA uridine-5-carboxymethylaminomethyl(34) synthesis GTPase MnmE [Simkaniaceae bacterium]|nr:tRNA uridine-5-carboxymethylaminomethyl(34) synthesis GTPase MnmE [Candidatus Sacchlamyda saccharinae]